jgi:outer membrane protein assembly factor BamB/tetratricopeptide (TPR) repeat protein
VRSPRRLLPLLAVLTPLMASARPQDDDRSETRFFSLPMSRDARELAATAREHLEAGRHGEGIDLLGRLLEEHRGEVLPVEWNGSGWRSQFPSYPGAAQWALRELLALPEEARELYRARYEPRAALALERVLKEPRRAGLLEVAQRWPATEAARRAWRALGDLEYECGREQAARLAWSRCADLTRAAGLEPEPADRARLERVERAPEDAARTSASLPRGDARPWRRDLDLSPFLHRGKNYYGYALDPLLHRERLLVSSSLRVFALDAFTGEVLWQAGPPEGWSALNPGSVDLFEGLDFDNVRIAPAAGGNVVVAALQVPFSENSNQKWQGIHIMSAIPERRLYAFDLETGRELWNHAPELVWDAGWQWRGESVPYPQRMMIAAPPVVAGSRVLVPCYRMQGRIDYHVACYDLETGRLEWSTQVISGQRERNMFGRSRMEFPASPLALAGHRVIAQTELGTVAALDLFTGALLWESLYRQTPLPKTNAYNAKARQASWRLTAPLVVGDVVLSTPVDSEELTAYDLTDGSTLWAYSENELNGLDRRTRHLSYNLLIGAEDDMVFLGGYKLAALRKPGGLRSRSPFGVSWLQPLPDLNYAPRPVLTEDAVLVVGATERRAYDRRSGEKLAPLSGTWNGGTPGNVWVEDGALYSLGGDGANGEGASGYFDWPRLLQRARLEAERQEDPTALREAAELFLRRGRIALDQDEPTPAREHLLEARDLFERLAARDGVDRSWRAGEVQCLRSLAEVYAREGRTGQALGLLDAGRALEPEREVLRDLLLQQEALLRGTGGERRVTVLDDLGTTCGSLPLPIERWLETQLAWRGRSDDSVPALTVAAWVRIERALENARLGRLGQALEDLHDVLREEPATAVVSGTTLGDVASRHISAILNSPAGRQAYEPFEQAARALFERAIDARDEAGLTEVARFFPHSRTAEEARDLRIERALVERDPERVVALVREALDGPAPEPARRTRWLLALARALGQSGNRELEQALVRDLAERSPDHVSELPGHGGRTLAALVAGHETPEAVATPPLPRFDARALPTATDREGLHLWCGALARASATPEEPPDSLQVWISEVSAQGWVLAYSSRAPTLPLWEHATAGRVEPERLVLAPDRIFFADEAGVHALDREGVELWNRPHTGDEPVRLAWRDGVLVMRQRSGRVRALETAHGLFLWETALAEVGHWRGPVTAPGRALFFSQVMGATPRARVLDLWTGHVASEFELTGFDYRGSLEEDAWTRDGLLIVPSYLTRPSFLAGFSLEDGSVAWTQPFGPEESLHSVAHFEEHTFVLTVTPSLATSGGNGGLYELSGRDGSLRSLMPLRTGERPMGIDLASTVTLAAPYLFLYSVTESDRGVPVRAVHLPYGLLWTWSLPVDGDEVYDGSPLPMPAVAEDCIAIAFQRRRSGRGQRNMDETSIVFVDKRTGRQQDSLVLDPRHFGAARKLALHGLGPALFAVALGSSPRGLHLEILESSR